MIFLMNIIVLYLLVVIVVGLDLGLGLGVGRFLLIIGDFGDMRGDLGFSMFKDLGLRLFFGVIGGINCFLFWLNLDFNFTFLMVFVFGLIVLYVMLFFRLIFFFLILKIRGCFKS